MSLRTDHLARCIQTLEKSLEQLQRALPDSIDYEIFRNAVVKVLTLETTGKLLRKALKSYTGNPRAVDELTYKDLLRQAARHGLMNSATVERWFRYRDNRNNTAHDYGVGFAEETLTLMPDFTADAIKLKPLCEKNSVMLRLDLKSSHLRLLQELFMAQLPEAEVLVYGSRATGEAHDGSDLDLVVRNPNRPDAPQPNLYRLRDALSESDLPIHVDVLDWARIPERFRQQIERQHVIIASPSVAVTR